MKWGRKGQLCILLVLGGLGAAAGLKLDWKGFFLSRESSCAFCNPTVLKQNTFYEGNAASALLTHKPAIEGHVLVIPKRHVVRFEELTDGELVEIKALIGKIDRISKKIYGSTGYLLLEKNGKEAGQSVPHVHFHYIPRREGENSLLLVCQILLAPVCKPLSSEAMNQQAALLSAEFRVGPI